MEDARQDAKQYWVYCHRCKENTRIDRLELTSLHSGCFNDCMLVCPCGNQVFGLEVNLRDQFYPIPKY